MKKRMKMMEMKKMVKMMETTKITIELSILEFIAVVELGLIRTMSWV